MITGRVLTVTCWFHLPDPKFKSRRSRNLLNAFLCQRDWDTPSQFQGLQWVELSNC